MTRVMESAAVQGWGALDCYAPTADETCPRCGAMTDTVFGCGPVARVEAELCGSCGWFAEFADIYDTDDGGER
jgi:hypothetical protein